MADSHRKKLEAWLADKSNWKSMGRLGRGFEGGARFVPIEGDGNCLFSAVSTALTCSKDKPLGTPDRHDDIRQKACDYIVTTRNSELMRGFFSRRRVPIKTDD